MPVASDHAGTCAGTHDACCCAHCFQLVIHSELRAYLKVQLHEALAAVMVAVHVLIL